MTIEEIKTKKKDVELQMSNMLIQFENETGISVSSISVDQISVMGRVFPKQISLTIEIK